MLYYSQFFNEMNLHNIFYLTFQAYVTFILILSHNISLPILSHNTHRCFFFNTAKKYPKLENQEHQTGALLKNITQSSLGKFDFVMYYLVSYQIL